MSADPYSVLGVPYGSSKDEVKKAYRTLAKRYHPDSHPGDKVAEQKMKEINAAYDEIMNGTPSGPRAGRGAYGSGYNPYGSSSSSSSSSGSSGYGTYTQGSGSGGQDEWPFGSWSSWGTYGNTQSQQQAETPAMRAVRNYINAQDYSEALHVLSTITDRTAQWYYYSAVANFGMGNRVQSQQDARQAVNMDPNNMEYRRFLMQVESMGQTYRTTRTYSMPQMGMGSFCMSFIVCNLLLTLFFNCCANAANFRGY